MHIVKEDRELVSVTVVEAKDKDRVRWRQVISRGNPWGEQPEEGEEESRKFEL